MDLFAKEERVVEKAERLVSWKDSIRKNASLSLLIVDIDYFKRYNDVYGHMEGDKCLQNVASTLMEMLAGDRIHRLFYNSAPGGYGSACPYAGCGRGALYCEKGWAQLYPEKDCREGPDCQINNIMKVDIRMSNWNGDMDWIFKREEAVLNKIDIEEEVEKWLLLRK